MTDARTKPRIRFWGNGDVYMECYDVYHKCYPNSIVTFRTKFIQFGAPKLTRLIKLN